MNLLARACALFGIVVVGAIATTGCSAQPIDEPADATNEAFSKKQCDQIHHRFIEDLNETNTEYKSCVAEAQRKLMTELSDIVISNVVGVQPCVGTALRSILVGKCLFSDDLPKCIFEIGEAALANIKASAAFTSCASNIFGKDAEGIAATEEYVKGLDETVYIALALAAAHTTAYVATYAQCADQLANDAEAVEPIACNPSKSICFDAPGCPTIAKTHSAKTHMTGLVDRSSIATGRATDTNGRRIKCSSYLVQGFSGGSTCHAN